MSDASDTAPPPGAAAPRAALSRAEERFERARRTLGLFLGPAVGVALFLLPMPHLKPEAHALAAVVGWVVTWWITEPIPISMTAVLGPALCVPLGVADARTVFGPFAEPTIFLFLGSFMLARAMSAHGLDRRFAYTILSLRCVGRSPARVLFFFGAICAAISMWISNTATTAMMYPLALAIAAVVGEGLGPGRARFATGLMLITAYASSTGGIGTPVGSPPNLVGLAMLERFAGVRIPFFQWMLFAVPLLIVMYLFLFAVLHLLHCRGFAASAGAGPGFGEGLRDQLRPWTAGERNALVAFLVAVTLWIVPGVLAIFPGQESALARAYAGRVPEAVAALVAAALLFVLPVNWRTREFTLDWRRASDIDWGTLVLFGGGLALGNLMFGTGLTTAIGDGLRDTLGATSTWGLTFAAIYLAIAFSELTSNVAAATMFVPVILSVALATHVDPVPPAIGATLGCSYAFVLPVSTPPNAIVYGSGLVPITRMIRAGLILNLLGGTVIWCALRVLLPLAGLG